MNQIASCDTRNGKNATKSVSNNLLKTNTNAERVRLWHLNKVIGQHLCPVALPLESMILPRWKDKELRCQLNRHSLSLELRFYFLALADLVSPLQGWKIGFITVNFSESVTQALTDKDKRSKAGAYANRINRRLKYRGVQAHWYGVLEDQKGNLHSHCIIAYHERDESTVKECFKQDTDMVHSGCRLQHRYKQRSRSNSEPQLKSQLFFHTDALGGFELAPIDIGAADYMSKSLEKKSSYMDIGSCRIFVPNQLRSSARSLYEAAWTQQKRLKSNQSTLTGLNCHQSLTYLLKGWKPSVSPADDRLYDEHATEIDELVSWNEFRNSKSSYDWQYEEDYLSAENYFNGKQEMAEELSEGEYDSVVKEAEYLFDQTADLEDMTEREYEWLMSEIAVLAKEHEKARSLSEGQYEALMRDINLDLEQYHLDTLSWQALTDNVVSDTEIDAFVMKRLPVIVPEKHTASLIQSISLRPRSTIYDTVLRAPSAVNIAPKQPCMERQIHAVSGARLPVLAARRSPLYSTQIERLRRFRVWGMPVYSKEGKTPLNVSRGVIKRCPLYQLSSMKTEWPPPMTSTSRS